MKRVAVTGATGMLGATLIRMLAARGIGVLALSRVDSAKRDNLPIHPLVRSVECDLANLRAIPKQSERYDAFYHFGWAGTSGAARNDTCLQWANVRYALDAVELASRLGCEVFIGAGSQAEFGRYDETLTPDTPVNPETGYGISKYAAEKLCGLRAHELGMRFLWPRIFSVYGPMDGDNSLTMSTIKTLLAGEKARFTAGEQVWDFLYSEDAARALMLLGEKGKDGTVYCIGSGKPVRLRDTICEMCEIVAPGSKPGLGEIPYPPGQVMHLCADISNLRADTGFSPQIAFSEGIRRTVNWYKEKYRL